MNTQSVYSLKKLVAALKRYRLERDFTYRQLGDLIGVPHSRLFEVMNAKEPRVNDRTMYQLETFAERVGLFREKVAS